MSLVPSIIRPGLSLVSYPEEKHTPRHATLLTIATAVYPSYFGNEREFSRLHSNPAPPQKRSLTEPLGTRCYPELCRAQRRRPFSRRLTA
jgi:hypothetical protein